jgi:alpha-L-rhamnosidase
MRVAEWGAAHERVATYRHLRREVAMAFQRELWVPEKELYRDGKPFPTSAAPNQWLPPDKDIETFSPHVNSLAVLYDLPPNNEQAAIMTKVMAGGKPNAQPYIMHFVFAALAHAGLFEEYAVPQMHRWQLNPETGSM